MTSAFTSAAAITICFTQVKALLGLKFPAEGFLDVTKGVIKNIGDVQVNDLMVSLVCTIVLLVLRVSTIKWISVDKDFLQVGSFTAPLMTLLFATFFANCNNLIYMWLSNLVKQLEHLFYD